MHKIITLIIMIFLAGNILAEEFESGVGVVEEVSVRGGYIVIDGLKYNIKHGKTKLLVPGGIAVDWSHLRKGSTVSFELDNFFITKIMFSTPVDG